MPKNLLHYTKIILSGVRYRSPMKVNLTICNSDGRKNCLEDKKYRIKSKKYIRSEEKYGGGSRLLHGGSKCSGKSYFYWWDFR